MTGTLKVTASLGVTNAKLKLQAQGWRVMDNHGPVALAWEQNYGPLMPHEEEVPLLDGEYVQKSAAFHMYLAECEQQERKNRWHRKSTNLSTTSELPPTS